MKPFQKLFEHCASRDVRKCLDPPLDMDWKSAPNVKWLVKQRTFFGHILDVVPNTVVTSRKLKDALQRLHDEEPLITNKKDENTLWDYLDTKIRIGLAQLRELKHNRDYCLDRGLRKLSEGEQRELHALLERVHFKQDDFNGAQTDSQPEDQHSPPQQASSLALVPASSPQEVAAASTTKGIVRTPPKNKKSPEEIEAVFNSILLGKKKTGKSNLRNVSSDPSTPDSIMFARKKLTFDEDDDDDMEEDEEEGTATKIKILPKGKSIMEQHNMKKKKDKTREEEVAAKKTSKIDDGKKKKKRCEASASSSGKQGGRSLYDAMLDDYAAGNSEGESEDVDENIPDDETQEEQGGGFTPKVVLSPVSRFLYIIAYTVCGMFESCCVESWED